MGSTLSPYQADLLSSYFDRVILMLDGDAAGRQGAASVAQALASRMPVTVISLQDEAQPDQLSPDEIQCLVSGRLVELETARE
jgi:DNA primase